jgi:hypothetical protein
MHGARPLRGGADHLGHGLRGGAHQWPEAGGDVAQGPPFTHLTQMKHVFVLSQTKCTCGESPSAILCARRRVAGAGAGGVVGCVPHRGVEGKPPSPPGLRAVVASFASLLVRPPPLRSCPRRCWDPRPHPPAPTPASSRPSTSARSYFGAAFWCVRRALGDTRTRGAVCVGAGAAREEIYVRKYLMSGRSFKKRGSDGNSISSRKAPPPNRSATHCGARQGRRLDSRERQYTPFVSLHWRAAWRLQWSPRLRPGGE